MPFGIDTFKTRLDLVPARALDSFRLWNGGTMSGGVVTSGNPEFAGRNFLGGDFLWGHSEATNSSSEQEGHLATSDPGPQHPENLQITVPFIAPIQAPQPTRQEMTGERGVLFGRLDARALCNRVFAGIAAGEFDMPNLHSIDIWLSVDSSAGFSADYWAGWSDSVNQFTVSVPVAGDIEVPLQPFRACILCNYAPGADGRLRPEPKVSAVLTTHAYPAFNIRCYEFWADAPVSPNPNAGLPANPHLDWNSFDAATMPLVWRLRNGFLEANGSVANVPFDVDAINPAGSQAANAFMLTTKRWQPNVPTIANIGFIVSLQDSANHEISDDAVTCIRNNMFPDMLDNSHNPTMVTGRAVTVVGRYLKTPPIPPQNRSHGFSMSHAEAQRLSNARLGVFTVWESFNDQVGGEPTLDQRHEADWGPFNLNVRRNIHYFNPANHAGTEDGLNAFTYCGDILKQPPQTPVFFAVDFDPLDLPDPNHPHPDPQHPVNPTTHLVPGPPGWPNLPNVAIRRQWIERYFELIKAARDDYVKRNPDRYYLIGVYGCGAVLQWCYEQGFVSEFWQAVSSGHNGSRPPHWPWYHCNRWQYQFTGGTHQISWPCANAPLSLVPGFDPDADWGDGGTWNLNDPPAARLSELERRELDTIERGFQEFWGDLLYAGQPHT